MTAARYIDAEARSESVSNRFALAGIDHVGLPCRDPDLAGRFVERVLGGVEFARFGYSEEDIRLGRPRHIFYHIGPQLLEVVEQEDGTGYTEGASDNSNPHLGFRASPQGLKQFTENLQKEGVPFSGPRSHGGLSAISVYFRDPDGNKLEVTSWDDASDVVETTPMGGKFGLIPWSKLCHNWRPE